MNEKDMLLLQAVIDTLGEVTVRGYDNMSKMLGSINALREIIQRSTEEASDGR